MAKLCFAKNTPVSEENGDGMKAFVRGGRWKISMRERERERGWVGGGVERGGEKER